MKLEVGTPLMEQHPLPLDLSKQRAAGGWRAVVPVQDAADKPRQDRLDSEGARRGLAPRPGLSLPPRKRPFPAEEGERPSVPEDPGPGPWVPARPKVKAEGPRTPDVGPPPPPAALPCLDHVYLPFGIPHIPCYPDTKPYYPSQFPVYPLPTHPIAISSLSAIPSTACSLLLSHGDILAADIAMATRQDDDGDTPLHIAVAQGDVQVVCRLIRLLLLGKKSLDIYNNLRQTPLHLAVITKHAHLTSILVSSGASPGLLDRHGQSGLHLACEHRSLECLQSLLLTCGQASDLEIRNYEGYSPLHLAIHIGDQDILTFLLEQGADIDAADIKSGRTSLVHAVENEDKDLVQVLLQHGASVNLQTYSGNTALHSASGRGLVDIVKVLLRNGADTSIKNCHNDTCLMVAKNKKVVDILRGKGSRPVAQPMTPTSPTNSPLHGATGSTPASPRRPPAPSCSPAQALLGPQPAEMTQPCPVGPLAPACYRHQAWELASAYPRPSGSQPPFQARVLTSEDAYSALGSAEEYTGPVRSSADGRGC